MFYCQLWFQAIILLAGSVHLIPFASKRSNSTSFEIVTHLLNYFFINSDSAGPVARVLGTLLHPQSQKRGHSCWARGKPRPHATASKGVKLAGALPVVPPRAKLTRTKPAVGARCPHLSWAPTPPLPIPLLLVGARGKNPGPHIRIRPVHTWSNCSVLGSHFFHLWHGDGHNPSSSSSVLGDESISKEARASPPNSHFLCQLQLQLQEKLNQTRALKLMWHLCMCLDVFRVFACHQAPPKLMDWAPRIPSKEKEQKSRRVSWT